MAGTMPRTSGVEPWQLAQTFIQELNRQAGLDEQSTKQLDTLPIEEAVKRRQMELANQLELKGYGEKLKIAEPYEISKEGRQSASRRGDYTYQTDEQIRRDDATEKRLVERYKTYPQLLQRGRTGTGTKITVDQSEGGNVVYTTDPAQELQMDDDPSFEKVGTVPDAKTGKPRTQYKRKGYTLGTVKDAPAAAGTMPSTTSQAPTSAPTASGKGDSQAPPGPTTASPSPTRSDPPAPFGNRSFDDVPPARTGKTSELGIPLLRTNDEAPPRFAALFSDAAEKTGVPADLIAATAYQESRWNVGAESPVGAQGLMQIMPGTARGLGVNPWNPKEAVRGGAEYLKQGLEAYDGNVGLALARYNAGPGGVQRYLAGRGLPKETRDYVKAITGHSIEQWVNGDVDMKFGDDEKPDVQASNEDDDPLFWVS